MELNLCPTCGAFVRMTWDNCQACGAVLESPALVAPVEEPVADEYLALEPEAFDDAPIAEEPISEEIIHEPAYDESVAEEPPVAEPVGEVAPPITASEIPDFAAFAEANGGSNFAAPIDTAVIEEPAPAEFNGQEPSFTKFSFFESEEVNPELASLAAGAPLTESTFSIPIDESRSWRERLLPREGLPIALTIVGVIALLSALSFLSMFYLYKPAPDQPTTASPTTSVTGEWKSYEQDGAFSVKLPSEPTIDITPTHVLYQSVVPGTQNRLEIYTAPVDPNRDKALDGQLMFNQLQATAVDRFTSVESNSFQAIDKQRRLSAHFANADKTINGDAQFFIMNDRMYGLWLMSPESTGDPETFSRMVEGFKPE